MELFGKTKAGTSVHALTIAGLRVEARILTLGGRLNGLTFDGSPDLVPVAPSVEDAYGAHRHSGPIIGPVINRLGGAARGGGTLLHSGDAGTQYRVWNVIAQADHAVTLQVLLRDGEGGFPGNRRVTAKYVTQDNWLSLDIEAETDAPTLMNVGHHPYWNLDGAESWDGHMLKVEAEEYLPVDDGTLPTGEIAKVAGTSFDLRELTAPPSTIDNNYCLTPADTPALAATLQGSSGRRLEVLTNAHGLQVFTGKPFAIALEPQLWPDAPNHANFPSIRLEPGKTFSQSTTYRFDGP